MLLYLSPKGKVLLLSGIMAAFGISVSIVIIAVHIDILYFLIKNNLNLVKLENESKMKRPLS